MISELDKAVQNHKKKNGLRESNVLPDYSSAPSYHGVFVFVSNAMVYLPQYITEHKTALF